MVLNLQAVEGAAHGCGTFPTPITGTPFPLPYKTDFSPQYVRFQDFPEFLSDIQGIFRIRLNPFHGTGEQSQVDSQLEPDRQQHSDKIGVEQQVLQQLTTEERAMTYGNGHGQLPMSLLGSKNWTDIAVTAVGRVNGTTADSSSNETLAVYARCGHGFAFAAAGGYVLQLWPASGRWELATGPTHGVVLANGTAVISGWTALQLAMAGTSIRASINGVQVAKVTDSTFANGMAALGSGWHPAYFKSFQVVPAS